MDQSDEFLGEVLKEYVGRIHPPPDGQVCLLKAAARDPAISYFKQESFDRRVVHLCIALYWTWRQDPGLMP